MGGNLPRLLDLGVAHFNDTTEFIATGAIVVAL